MPEIFSDFPFIYHTTQKSNFAKVYQNLFQIPSTEKSGFCQLHFSFSHLNTGLFSKRWIFQKLFSKTGRRLFSCKWERLLVQPELKQCFQKRFRDIILCVLVCLPAYPGGIPYVAPVMLQHKVDRFRLAAGRLYDCFIGEKPVIPPAPVLWNIHLLCRMGSTSRLWGSQGIFLFCISCSSSVPPYTWRCG